MKVGVVTLEHYRRFADVYVSDSYVTKDTVMWNGNWECPYKVILSHEGLSRILKEHIAMERVENTKLWKILVS